MAKTKKQIVQAFHDAEMKRKKALGALMLAQMATDGTPTNAVTALARFDAHKAAVVKAAKGHEKACEKEEETRQRLADSMKAGGWTDDDVKMFGEYFSTGSRPR
jgi:hypothetical protein